jgi:hypothetical protein
LLRNPGFTAVAVLSLALGIGATTTIFNIVNVLLLRPPPVEKPDELWQIWQLRPKASWEMKRHGVWTPAEIAYFREHNQSFAALGAFHYYRRSTNVPSLCPRKISGERRGCLVPIRQAQRAVLFQPRPAAWESVFQRCPAA